MTRSLVFQVVVGLWLTLLVGTATAQRERPTTRQMRDRAEAAMKDLSGKVRFDDFPSKLMGRDVRFAAYTPPGYDDPANKDKRYPVIFFLHGLFESPERWVMRGGMKFIDDPVKAKEFPPCVLVVADGGTSFYCDTKDGKQPYGRFYIEEFVPFVDRTFRTFGDRPHRLIAGSSMGGFGALKFAFLHPELFVAVAVHSAALLPEDLEQASPRAHRAMGYMKRQLADIFGDPVDKKIWDANNPMVLARKFRPAQPLGIYFDCGSEDSYGFDEGCRELGKILDECKIPHETAIRPGDHGWEFLRDAVRFSVPFLKKHLEAAAPADAAAAGQPKKEPSGAASRPAGN